MRQNCTAKEKKKVKASSILTPEQIQALIIRRCDYTSKTPTGQKIVSHPPLMFVLLDLCAFMVQLLPPCDE